MGLKPLLKTQHGHLHHTASLAKCTKTSMYKYQEAEITAHESRSVRLFMVSACVPRVWGFVSLYTMQLLQDRTANFKSTHIVWPYYCFYREFINACSWISQEPSIYWQFWTVEWKSIRYVFWKVFFGLDLNYWVETNPSKLGIWLMGRGWGRRFFLIEHIHFLYNQKKRGTNFRTTIDDKVFWYLTFLYLKKDKMW